MLFCKNYVMKWKRTTYLTQCDFILQEYVPPAVPKKHRLIVTSKQSFFKWKLLFTVLPVLPVNFGNKLLSFCCFETGESSEWKFEPKYNRSQAVCSIFFLVENTCKIVQTFIVISTPRYQGNLSLWYILLVAYSI